LLARPAAAAGPGDRTEGPTPNGGAYAIAYTHDDGSMEIVEFDANDQEVTRSYGVAWCARKSLDTPVVRRRPC
jgi:hypothetical protein